MTRYDPFSIALFMAALSLLPMLLITTTSFLKTAIVLLIARNAIGVQQVPPTMVIYGMAMMLTVFTMAPTFHRISDIISRQQAQTEGQRPLTDTLAEVAEPLRGFMLKHTSEEQRAVFLEKAKLLWPKPAADEVRSGDFVVLVPAFTVSEMQAGFEMGFLIYIPFLVVDMFVSNLLLALGMQMVSPMMVSVPLKIFLFVAVDGWGKLLNAILDSYL
jgi:type III secretion protein R